MKRKPVDEIKELITFRHIGNFELLNLKQDNPSCFNGYVRVTKTKIVVEDVVEPVEVIWKRIQGLWDKSDNHHDHEPLQNAAKKYGYVIQGDRGNKK